MDLTIGQLAASTGTSRQYVGRAIASGDLAALREVGETVIIDDLAAQAWDRTRARGRRWTDEVRRAAFDLLNTGATDRLSSSERSRLRANLRTISAGRLAHLAGGLGGAWARYRVESADRSFRGASRTASVDGLRGLVVDDAFMTFLVTEDLDDFELDNDVLLDASGNVGVVERTEVGGRIREFLDTNLLAGARDSAAAAARIEEVAHAL